MTRLAQTRDSELGRGRSSWPVFEWLAPARSLAFRGDIA